MQHIADIHEKRTGYFIIIEFFNFIFEKAKDYIFYLSLLSC